MERDEGARGVVRNVSADGRIVYVELEGESELLRFSPDELSAQPRTPIRTKNLPDGTQVRMHVHGSSSVEIDGKTFHVGDDLGPFRIVAITDEKVKLRNGESKRTQWYKRDSRALVIAARRSE